MFATTRKPTDLHAITGTATVQWNWHHTLTPAQLEAARRLVEGFEIS